MPWYGWPSSAKLPVKWYLVYLARRRPRRGFHHSSSFTACPRDTKRATLPPRRDGYFLERYGIHAGFEVSRRAKVATRASHPRFTEDVEGTLRAHRVDRERFGGRNGSLAPRRHRVCIFRRLRKSRPRGGMGETAQSHLLANDLKSQWCQGTSWPRSSRTSCSRKRTACRIIRMRAMCRVRTRSR